MLVEHADQVESGSPKDPGIGKTSLILTSLAMRAFILLALTTCLGAQAAPRDTRNIMLRVEVADGSSFNGTAALPGRFAVQTKFGNVDIDPATIVSITRTPGSQWRFALTDATTVTGNCALGPLDLLTMGGKITIAQEDLRNIRFPRNSSQRAPPASTADVRKQEDMPSAFDGVKYRETAENYRNRIPYAPAILLSTRRHIALLDHASEECVFYEIVTGGLTRVKTEAQPVCLVEKNGKVYVANSRSNSLSIIGVRSLLPQGRLPLGTAPLWLTAPARGNVLYFVASETNDGIHAVDTEGDRHLGPITSMDGKGRITGWHLAYVTVSPDNRLLITQTGRGSPSCRPDLYHLSNGRFTRILHKEVELHTSHPGPFHPDLNGRRMYCGYRIYSSDMRRLIGQPPCAITVPHPSRPLVFGAKKGAYSTSTSKILVVLDEEKLTVLKEIPLGDTILNLVPTEKTLFVVGPKTLYPIDLSDLLPDALADAPSRIVPHLDRTIDRDSILKADRLVQAAQKDLDARRFAESRRTFEEADRIDPFCSARVGLGMLLVREGRHEEAIAHLEKHLGYPFRNDADLPILYNQLGIAYAQTRRLSKAIEIFRQGIQRYPRNPSLLRNLGTAYANAGNNDKAYLYLGKALAIDPALADASKMRDEILSKIRRSSTAACPVCTGNGKFELILEEEGAPLRKISTVCDTCKGRGKTWKRPCTRCMGSGDKDFYTFCESCLGRGYQLEPAP